MMKKTLLLTLALTMSLATPMAVFAEESSTEKQKLSLWWWQGDMEEAWNNNLIADFEAANPNIDVELTIMPWSDYWQKVQTATVSDTLPDLMIMSVAYIEQYARAGVVLDLKDYIDRDLDRNDYYEFAMKTTQLEDGHEYGMPWNVVENCLFYNKDLFDEAGIEYPDETWTMDTLRETAKALTIPEKDQYGLSTILAGEVALDSFLYSYGGAIVSDNLTTCVLDSPESKEAIKFLRDMLLEDKSMTPTSVNRGGISDFSTGLVAMCIEGCWALETMATSDEINWDIAPLPAGPEGSKPRAWSDSICITKSCKDPETAWSFIKYLVGENGQTNANLTSTRIPVYIPASMGDVYLKSDTVSCDLQILLNQLDIASPFVFRGNWGEWVGILGNELSGVFTGDLDLDEGVAQATEAIQIVLDEYNLS